MLTPPTYHRQPEPGEALYHITGIRWCQSFALPAITALPTTLAKVRYQRPNGKTASVSVRSIVYRGYCAACACPAHDRAGRLVCPQCDEEAIAVPPPLELVVRWVPLGSTLYHIAARYAFLNPAKSWTQAWDVAHGTLGTIRENISRTMWRLGLPVLEESQNTNQWISEGHFFRALRFYAFTGDNAAFLETYQGLADRREQGAALARHLEELKTFLSDPTGLGITPPAPYVAPADDQTPDGADETTRWLEQQFRRAA